MAVGTHASTSRMACAQAHRRPSGGARCLAMLAACQQHDRWGCCQPPLAPAFNIESGSGQAAAASYACCLGSSRPAADGCLAVVLLWRAGCRCRQTQCATGCFCTPSECAQRTHVRWCILLPVRSDGTEQHWLAQHSGSQKCQDCALVCLLQRCVCSVVGSRQMNSGGRLGLLQVFIIIFMATFSILASLLRARFAGCWVCVLGQCSRRLSTAS